MIYKRTSEGLKNEVKQEAREDHFPEGNCWQFFIFFTISVTKTIIVYTGIRNTLFSVAFIQKGGQNLKHVDRLGILRSISCNISV